MIKKQNPEIRNSNMSWAVSAVVLFFLYFITGTGGSCSGQHQIPK